MKRLNLIEPDIWIKATDTISDQIKMIKTLEKRGYTYRTSDGIYFDTSKFKYYTKLSHQNLRALQEGARVEKNDEKKNPTDFALWKFSRIPGVRQQEWDSPWGIGFPGWHLECSVMSMKALSDQLDIHCGGVDHINVHHTNEIAQSEAATDKKFFNYWMHGAFLNMAGGKKMAKSEENFLTLENAVIKKGRNPQAFRYAVLSVHYRKPMEYSWRSMTNAQMGYNHLCNQTKDLGQDEGEINKTFKNKFLKAINDDLNMPKALAITQEMLKSNLSNKDKLATVLDFDKVLGLKLKFCMPQEIMKRIPKEIIEIGRQREKARKNKDWAKADKLRREIEKKGYIIEDIDDTFLIMGK
jgi:cysteinyl-tRNA synthetase